MQKRIFDLTIVMISVVFWLPLMVLLTGAVAMFLGPPIFFRQMRPGRNGKPFELIKFRTMKETVDAQGNLLPDAERLTPFGSFLRNTSLDELPEIFNVLKGEMSLVGPRPLLMEYLPLYSPGQARRHEVAPGLTGWAQINGRNDISWNEKFLLDLWYVDNHNLRLDIAILLKTAYKVSKCEDITQTGEATAKKFSGNDRQ